MTTKALRWMLWNRRRLTITAAAVFLGMGFLSMAAGAVTPQGGDDTTTRADRGAGATTTTLGGGVTRPNAVDSPQSEALATAEKFLDVWMSKQGDSPEALRPYATSQMVSFLYSIDRTQVPTGEPGKVRLRTINQSSALVRAVLPGGVTAFLSLVPDDDGWKVDSLTGEQA